MTYNKLGQKIEGIYKANKKIINEGGGWGNEEQHDKSISKLILKFKKKSKEKNINKEMKNIKSWEEFNKLNEDGEGGGVGMGAAVGGGAGSSVATLGNTGGMGAMVSAQPSSIPGDVAGSIKGSGDIGGKPMGPYSKIPAVTRRKNKNKKDKPYHKIGAGIDNFYKTSYVQSGSDSNVVQKWKAFTDTK
jgi:hypothetical protein